MANNSISEGNSIQLTSPAGGTTSGLGYIIGNLFGVAAVDSSAGDKVAFGITGVWDLAKQSGVTLSEGDLVTWDDSNKEIRATGDRVIGHCTKDAASADTSAEVRLSVNIAT